MPLISWDKISRTKTSRVLGVRKMEAVNTAFISKLTWKIFHDHSLWEYQMAVKYPVNTAFFNSRTKQPDSWTWKCILKNRPQFRKGIR